MPFGRPSTGNTANNMSNQVFQCAVLMKSACVRNGCNRPEKLQARCPLRHSSFQDSRDPTGEANVEKLLCHHFMREKFGHSSLHITAGKVAFSYAPPDQSFSEGSILPYFPPFPA